MTLENHKIQIPMTIGTNTKKISNFNIQIIENVFEFWLLIIICNLYFKIWNLVQILYKNNLST